MIEQRSLSYSEYTTWLSRSIKPEDLMACNDRDLTVWIRESITLRKTIYPTDPELFWNMLISIGLRSTNASSVAASA